MAIEKLKINKTNTALIERIVEMRSSGLTYDKIGLEIGLSRERIRQLYNNENRDASRVITPKPLPWLKTREVSQLVNIHVSTVRRWADQGVIKSYRIGPRGDRRFKIEDVNSLFKKRGYSKSN